MYANYTLGFGFYGDGFNRFKENIHYVAIDISGGLLLHRGAWV